VSHNMAAVENLCSRAIWISSGEVRMDGPTHAVIEAYMSTFASPGSASNALASVDGRRGTGEIRYTRVEFLSTDGELQSVIRAGESIVIRLHYHASEPVERPNFGMCFLTNLGTLVTDTSTWLHGLDIPLLRAGDGYVELAIDSLNLLPGHYHLSVWVNSCVRTHMYDGLERAVHLDVEEMPVYGSSRPIDSRYGVVFFRQRWRLDGIGGVAAHATSPATVPATARVLGGR